MRKSLLGCILSTMFASSASLAQVVDSAPPESAPPVFPAPLVECCSPPAERLWFTGEYLLWWTKGASLPPLVTEGPLAVAGFPGRPLPLLVSASDLPVQSDAALLFGGTSIDNGARSGARFSAGYWFDDSQSCGIEASYLFLSTRSRYFTASGSGTGTDVLARPVIDAATGQPAIAVVAGDMNPGNFLRSGYLLAPVSGTVDVTLSNQFQGADLNGLFNVSRGDGFRIDALAGFRFLYLHEGLRIGQNSTLNEQGYSPMAGGTFSAYDVTGSFDEFQANNYFYGGQIGARAEVRRGRFTLAAVGKIAFGSTQETVEIAGNTTLTSTSTSNRNLFFPPQPIVTGPTTTSTPGGLLAQPTNIGRYSRDAFAVVPEVGANLGINLTDWLRASVGYTFLYWSEVARPGEQIDRVVNQSQLYGNPLVGEARPTFSFHGSDFWVQGVNFGLEFLY